jgi:hypothetical protein
MRSSLLARGAEIINHDVNVSRPRLRRSSCRVSQKSTSVGDCGGLWKSTLVRATLESTLVRATLNSGAFYRLNSGAVYWLSVTRRLFRYPGRNQAVFYFNER